MIGVVAAGCLSNADPGSGDGDGDGGEQDGDDDNQNDDDPGGGDEDEYSIDGRLHNEGSSTRTFEVTIRNEDDEIVTEDDWEVDPDDTVSVPALGKPGDPRTFDVTVDDATKTETFAFDVEATPEAKDGYVDITYTEDDTLVLEFTPAGDDHGDDEFPRVDEPPYDITEPECGEEADRDPLWLCENMDEEPSVAFEQGITTGRIFADEGLSLENEEPGKQYYATLLTADDDLDRLEEEASGPAVELIEEADFETEAVIVVQTGWGSGSEAPHLKRIEDTEDGIHAFGCYRRPCMGTTDYTMRTVVARFERPDRLDDARVSLTVHPDMRVNVAADEGVVTVSEEEEAEAR